MLDDSGDVDITSNDLSLVTGPDEVKQLLTQRLRTFLSEWFLDNTVGIPYIQSIFQKQSDFNLTRSLILTEIAQTPGVLEVQEYELDYTRGNRKLDVDTRVRVEDDVINFSEVIP